MTHKLYEIKEELIDNLTAQIKEKGLDRMSTTETGQVIDMIKDLAQAEKYCWEACYYKSVVEAMDEGSDYMGYGSATGSNAPMVNGYGGRGSQMRGGNQGSGYSSRMGGRSGYDPAVENIMQMIKDSEPHMRDQLFHDIEKMKQEFGAR